MPSSYSCSKAHLCTSYHQEHVVTRPGDTDFSPMSRTSLCWGPQTAFSRDENCYCTIVLSLFLHTTHVRMSCIFGSPRRKLFTIESVEGPSRYGVQPHAVGLCRPSGAPFDTVMAITAWYCRIVEKIGTCLLYIMTRTLTLFMFRSLRFFSTYYRPPSCKTRPGWASFVAGTRITLRFHVLER